MHRLTVQHGLAARELCSYTLLPPCTSCSLHWGVVPCLHDLPPVCAYQLCPGGERRELACLAKTEGEHVLHGKIKFSGDFEAETSSAAQ